MLLAQLLPIWEKSGVNPSGTINTTNPILIEDVQDGTTDSNGAPIDVQFYKLFWGLQKHFQVWNGVSILIGVFNWISFQA